MDGLAERPILDTPIYTPTGPPMAQKTVRWFLFFFLSMRSTATGNLKPRRRQLWATADSPEEEEGGWGSQRLAGAYAPPCVMGRSAYACRWPA